MKTIKRRRIEIIAFERERLIRQPGLVHCPICHLGSEMLTIQQAGALAQVKVETIRRWLAQGKTHGVKTSGGQSRICKNSLFCPATELD